MQSSHTIIYNLKAIAKGRPRFSGHHTYTPTKTRDFESQVRQITKTQFYLKPLEGPLEVSLLIEFKKPKSSKNLLPSVRPDIDNAAKSVLDPNNSLLWKDDSQICSLEIKKIYSEEDKITLRVSKIA